MGVGEMILYWPNDGVRSDAVGGILRILIGVRGVGTATNCLDWFVVGVAAAFITCCCGCNFCGVPTFDPIRLWFCAATAV